MKTNYNELKNYIHNDLHITKDDIRAMLKETVNEAVEKLLNSGAIENMIRYNIDARIAKAYGRGLGDNFESNIRGQVAREIGLWIASQLNISVTQSDKPEKVNLIRVIDNK